ncbi:CCT domain-containing protein [Heracleum sosnowskyi]|uniref:CCT domain-containing protein n=1 Tax=Heracleum sosnowskyi TaxID=360622 RepID=A0AAD8H6W2_9APIA|nr:CCT domain-containing protein [Heracleum sosnowskyi]
MGDSATGVLHPYHHNFYQDLQPFDAFWDSTHSMDYDLGAEGDLFKAPKPIIEQQMNEQLLSEVFCEFEKDLLANEAIGTPVSNDLQIQIPVATDKNPAFVEEKVLSQGTLLKSVSAECLSSTERIHRNPTTPNSLDIHGIDFGITYSYGMRRSFSEGDIKTTGNDAATVIKSPLAQPQFVLTSITEARKEKLSRYRAKRAKRNFGRKIKYACRKALADSQPRVRGRFAKTEEIDSSKK